MPTIRPNELERLAIAIFRAMGASDEESQIVGQHLVEANLAGHDSHGVLRIPQYFKAIRAGRIRPDARVKIDREAPAGLVLYIATSVAPEGKLRAYRQRGERVPDGWIMDHTGRSTTDPKDFYGPPVGSLLPLGGPAGHKGFGLAFMFDILAGALSGAGCSGPNAQPTGDGLFLMAIDVQQFSPIEEFHARIAELVKHVKSSPATSVTNSARPVHHAGT